jgi:cobalt-zinc-cadmium efflux system membrane fusion protein
MYRSIAALCAVLMLAGCGSPDPVPETKAEEHHGEGDIALTPEQIAAAGIALVTPGTTGASAAIEAPALLEAEPDATRIVAATVSGRIVSLTRNLGERVTRGETLAVIESREAAALHAEVDRARTRLDLAQAMRRRDEALYAQGFRPLRELEITRAAATEAEVALRLARQQVSASGTQGGSLNRIAITAPISGQVIARRAMLGQTFMADAPDPELFRIANLDRLTATLSLPAGEAALVRPGARIDLDAGGRTQQAIVRFVSPVLDEETRLVRILADVDNKAGLWRAGEPVQARIRLAGDARQGQALMIPANAVQTIGNRPAVFVRTGTGFRATPVTLGRRDGPLVAITQGLKGGETIAAANSFILKAELGKGEAGHED